MVNKFSRKCWAGALSFAVITFSAASFAKQKTAIVVGAGLSGLTAAYELQENNYDVTVLEARDRAGGRIYTLVSGFKDNQHAEAGGELLDAERVHPAVHSYINEFDLGLEDVGYDEVDGAYYVNGQLVPFDDVKKVLGKKINRDFNRFWDALEELAELVPSPEYVDQSPNAYSLDRMSVADWLDTLELLPESRTLADQYINGEYGSPEDVSLLFLAHQTKVYEDIDDDEVEIFRVAGGNSRLPEAFAEKLNNPVVLNAPVTEIKQNRKRVTVLAGGKAYKADYVVVTVPAPVLNKIEFTPNLPISIRVAADQLSYGSHTKVIMQFSKRFWLEQGLSGDTASELPIGWTWEATDQQDGQAGILIAYTSGRNADAQKYKKNSGIIKNKLKQVEAMYPGSTQYFLKAQVQSWNREPWTGGGYSAYSPGQVTSLWGAFDEPYGRIFFAGEHTDTLYPGYMEGAVRSGQKAAESIVYQ